MPRSNKRRIPSLGVTLGDAAGIGPEVIIKALNNSNFIKKAKIVVIGDKQIFDRACNIVNAQLDYLKCKDFNDFASQSEPGLYIIDQHNISPSDFVLGEVSKDCGKAIAHDIAFAVEGLRKNLIDGIVYGPLSKEALCEGGINFSDELHYFASLLELPAEHELFGEMNKVGRLWLGRVASHVAIKDVASLITHENVLRALTLTYQTVLQYGKSEPEILVAGLNPHCGDGGLFGTEEKAIAYAIEIAKEKGINAKGPYPSDTIFLRYLNGEGNTLLAMYHDQGQIGAKLLGFNKAVTVLAGFPYIICTPAHGSGFEIAGKGIANEKASKEAFSLAIQAITKNKR